MPQITHHTRSIRIAPRKLRLIVDKIRHQNVANALETLPLVNKGGSLVVAKALKAAQHAAVDANLDPTTLTIQQAWVDEATSLKRVMRFSRGRSAMIMKKYSHIGFVLKGEEKRAVKRVRAAKQQEQAEAADATEAAAEEKE